MLKNNFLLSALGFGSLSQSSIGYSQWISKVEPYSIQVDDDIEKDDLILSIILFTSSDLDNDLFQDSIISVVNQTASNWELLVVTSSATLLHNTVLKDRRIKFSPAKKESNSFESINFASKDALGDFITFIHEGDKLSPHAVMQLNRFIADNPAAQLVVTDEDLLDSSGQRCQPFFKPDWNPDYLSNYNYFSQGVVYNCKFFNDLGGFNTNEESPNHALALSATRKLKGRQICHLDKILFHFKRPIKDSIHQVQFDIPQPAPLVTIIIPTKDKLELLKPCIDGVLNKTAYDNFEIIIIDNQSEESETQEYLLSLKSNFTINILNYEKHFNYSEMNNLAVKQAKGELVCFLNNDISIIKDDWLTEMVSHACRPEIGCVGAKLLYPDGTIQHAGVILGLKGYASHAHKGFDGEDVGYFNRLVVTHNVSAVTAACMLMRKETFDEVGGFDAKNLEIAYNDVDLCLKVRELGYRNLFTPHAQLIHHESKSRGKKRNKKQQKQLRKESEFLVKKWGGVLYSDPAYNKNLTLLREDFSLDMDRLES